MRPALAGGQADEITRYSVWVEPKYDGIRLLLHKSGRRIERPSASGARPGVELAPAIVVTVKMTGIVKDMATGKLALRDPKIAALRSDKSPQEADTTAAIDQLFLKQRMG